MKKYSEKYIFESMSVPRAVATLAIPTMISQGLLNIPLLIVMDVFIGLYGMIWTQLVVEVIMLPVSLGGTAVWDGGDIGGSHRAVVWLA